MAATPSPKIKQKLIILLIIMALIFLALVLRLFQVEILKGDEYAARAARQQTRNTALNAQRGRIMDRNGIVLAQSGTSYRVLVNPQVIAESERVRISIEVSDVLGLDYDYVYERVCRVEKQQIVLKRQVESGVVDQLTALQLGRGISFSADMKRYYPMGNLFSQLIGFTGTDGEGQTGIEASYDEYLAGKNGRLVTEVDRNNHALSYGEEEYIAPIDGYDMTLTTDSVAESYVETAVAECYSVNKAKQVTALLMNPKTGEILSSTTYPTFDLNAPPRSDVASLLEMSRNRSVSETYEPGSIFKIITLAAALDSGAVTMEDTFSCKGYEQYGFEKIRCWKTKGHGTQTLAEAVQNSCNCAFMQMAQKMGVNTLYDYIYAFGFGASTECGIPGEDEGSIIHRKYIRDADLARVSFGQSITVTPVQMLNAACAAINGGVLMQPYVVSSITATDGTSRETNRRNSAASSPRTPRQRCGSCCRALSKRAAERRRRCRTIPSAARPERRKNTMRTVKSRARCSSPRSSAFCPRTIRSSPVSSWSMSRRFPWCTAAPSRRPGSGTSCPILCSITASCRTTAALNTRKCRTSSA